MPPGLVIAHVKLRSGRHLMASDDQADFEAYVARDSGRLHGFATLLGGTWPDAEDLVQQALLRAASRWPTARERPEAYTRKILVNLARDRWRSRRFTAEHAAQCVAPNHWLCNRLCTVSSSAKPGTAFASI